ncbi:hypothetical protein ACFLT5_01295 [Chloroflexota bacterium]
MTQRMRDPQAAGDRSTRSSAARPKHKQRLAAFKAGIVALVVVLAQSGVNLEPHAQGEEGRLAHGWQEVRFQDNGSPQVGGDAVRTDLDRWTYRLRQAADTLQVSALSASASALPWTPAFQATMSLDQGGSNAETVDPPPRESGYPGDASGAPGSFPMSTEDAVSVPDWLEPRGLNVVDLVGLVPDDMLQGMILSFGDGVGIVVYESGSRVGDTVVVTAKLYPRFDDASWAPNHKLTIFGCLGQTPHFDHMGTVAPPSVLRVYDGDVEVTQQIQYMWLSRMDRSQPYASSKAPFRYWEADYGAGWTYPLPLGPNGLALPKNSGCQIWIPGQNYYPLTGVFTISDPDPLQAEVLGTQHATFHSYIGPGATGVFSPLMNQMDDRYGWRHGSTTLTIPGGTNFFIAKYPPMPGDAYTDTHWDGPNLNADRLSSGTYRLDGDELGTDLTISAAFPIGVAWRDSDLSGGSTFLPVMRHPPELALPEYVIPAGVPFNPCFTDGGCSGPVLEQVYNTVMSIEITYLSITKPRTYGDWIPLRMAGPAWSPPGGTTDSSLAGVEPAVYASGSMSSSPSATHRAFLPYISNEIYDPVPTGCPCGWFDSYGAMLGFSP